MTVRIHVCTDPEAAWLAQLDAEFAAVWEDHEHQLDLEHDSELARREVDMFYARESVDPYAPEDKTTLRAGTQVLDVLLLWDGAWDHAEPSEDAQ